MAQGTHWLVGADAMRLTACGTRSRIAFTAPHFHATLGGRRLGGRARGTNSTGCGGLVAIAPSA
eukprot:scaffold134388_cov17-Tisochrysis_lutea.AAC.1